MDLSKEEDVERAMDYAVGQMMIGWWLGAGQHMVTKRKGRRLVERRGKEQYPEARMGAVLA